MRYFLTKHLIQNILRRPVSAVLMSIRIISCLPVPVSGLFSENHRNTMTIPRKTGNLLNK
ncbi:hypothetical protein LDENG_00277140 [Lucifuga dentata]|nr:hypothetical protein LDENG_00277140 [Lucifuga dentata]